MSHSPNVKKVKVDKPKKGYSVTKVAKYLNEYHVKKLYLCLIDKDQIPKDHSLLPSIVTVEKHSEIKSYPTFIIEYPRLNGAFYDQYLRKLISNLIGINAKDDECENMKSIIFKNVNIEDNLEDGKVHQKDEFPFRDGNCIKFCNKTATEMEQLKRKRQTCIYCYENIFTCDNRPVDELIDAIFYTSVLNIAYYPDHSDDYVRHFYLNFDKNYFVSDNLKQMKQYIKSVPNIRKSSINPICDCIYFTGHADLIVPNFDSNGTMANEECIVDFKAIRKHFYLEKQWTKFTQLILYAVSKYKKEQKKIRHFMIYNPLSGKEYHLRLPNINFEKLCQLLDKVLKDNDDDDDDETDETEDDKKIAWYPHKKKNENDYRKIHHNYDYNHKIDPNTSRSIDRINNRNFDNSSYFSNYSNKYSHLNYDGEFGNLNKNKTYNPQPNLQNIDGKTPILRQVISKDLQSNWRNPGNNYQNNNKNN